MEGIKTQKSDLETILDLKGRCVYYEMILSYILGFISIPDVKYEPIFPVTEYSDNVVNYILKDIASLKEKAYGEKSESESDESTGIRALS